MRILILILLINVSVELAAPGGGLLCAQHLVRLHGGGVACRLHLHLLQQLQGVQLRVENVVRLIVVIIACAAKQTVPGVLSAGKASCQARSDGLHTGWPMEAMDHHARLLSSWVPCC